MNRRLRVCLLALLGSGCLLSPSMAQDMPPGAPAPAAPAQPSGEVNIPDFSPQLKGQAPTVQEREMLAKWVNAHLSMIAGGNSAQQKTSRDKLINAMPRPTDPGVVPAFIEAYAKALDDEIVTALKAKPPLRTRLLMAIVVARTADKADTVSYPLAESTELLLQDNAEPVVIWGMKSAKVVLPHLLALPANQYKSLLDRIVPTALKFPGPVLEEAYLALTLEQLGLTRRPAEVAKMAPRITAVLPHVHSLLASRVTEWSKGVPKYPLADSWATLFLSTKGMWDLQNPAQQKQAVVLILDLLNAAAPAFNATPKENPLKNELHALIQRGAQAMGVIAGITNETSVATAAAVLAKIIPNTHAKDLDTMMATLTPAVKAMKIMQAPSAPGAAGTAGTPVPVGAAR